MEPEFRDEGTIIKCEEHGKYIIKTDREKEIKRHRSQILRKCFLIFKPREVVSDT